MDDEKAAVKVKAHYLACATIFLAQCDKRRYGKLIEKLENRFTQGQDGYPENMVTAFKMINKYKNWQPTRVVKMTGMAFAMNGRSGARSDNDDWKKNSTCHEHGKKGHIHTDCPSLK